MTKREYSTGVAGDGAAILRDGKVMSVEEIVIALRAAEDAEDAVYTYAYALCDSYGGFDCRTISATRRAAVINAFLVNAIRPNILVSDTDEEMFRKFEAKFGSAYSIKTVAVSLVR